MVVVAPTEEQKGILPARLQFALDGVIRSYSQILFNTSRPVGILLLAATVVAPVPAIFGLSAVLLALGLARAFGFSPENIRSGLFGYNALLLGLGLGALYEPSWTIVGLLVVATILAVLATATFNSALGASYNLPTLTLPFLLVFYLLSALVYHLKGVALLPYEYSPFLLGEWLPHPVASYLKSLGAIFFLPRFDAGLMVMAALLVYSRIGFVLSLLGFAIAYPLSLYLVAVPDAELHLMMGYNLILVAVALGGVWFVPKPSSFVFAAAAVLMSAVLTVAGRNLLGRVGLPLLILPFNLTVIPILYAMRQRIRDSYPKSVDFAMGTPEQNLNYYQTRMERFGYLYYVKFTLPFRGRWVCTQGNDGPHTHKGPWRHGLDFEVKGQDGELHRGAGKKAEEFHCFGLPVLAPADGTVAKVVTKVEDNRIGEINTEDNWGNLVMLYHGPGLYSVMAHLAHGSIKLKVGDVVRRSDQIGLCGNSGRSPMPHLHFQLQGTARLGAPTLPVAFHEIVEVADEQEELRARLLPDDGSVVRNLDSEPEIARLFSFPIGEKFMLATAESEGQREEIESEIDLFGNLSLRCPKNSARLFFENKDSAFIVYDYLGPLRSALYLTYVALPRVPFETGGHIRWKDHLASRYFHPWPTRLLRDFVSPILNFKGLEMHYTLKRKGDGVLVTGRSAAKGRGGVPLVSTSAEMADRKGLMRVEVTARGKTRVAIRREDD